jgi:hypothetical protein
MAANPGIERMTSGLKEGADASETGNTHLCCSIRSIRWTVMQHQAEKKRDESEEILPPSSLSSSKRLFRVVLFWLLPDLLIFRLS